MCFGTNLVQKNKKNNLKNSFKWNIKKIDLSFKNFGLFFIVLMNTTGFTCGSKKLIAMSRKK